MFCRFCGGAVDTTFAFCPFCGTCQPPIGADEIDVAETDENTINTTSLEELLHYYFERGFTYQKILLFLSKYHDVNISMRTLKSKLHAEGLQRKCIDYNIDEIRRCILQRMQGCERSVGYRHMWHALRLDGIQVPRTVVQQLMHELDPEGCTARKARCFQRRRFHSRGPNWSWHIDGYDKLKPYGFPIHGCIDSFSRKVLWLKVCRTNNDPSITAQHFLSCVTELSGCPMLVRTDLGSENVVIAGMQCYFRCNGTDEFSGIKAHRYGTSPANQRIEAWWSYLRKNWSDWWIRFFKDLIESGRFQPGNELHMECLWFCFSYLIQEELDRVQEHWNTHYIRRSRYDTIAGKPDELFYLPETVSSANYLHPVALEQLDDMSEYCSEYQEENLYQEYFSSITHAKPSNWRTALTLYENILTVADQE